MVARVQPPFPRRNCDGDSHHVSNMLHVPRANYHTVMVPTNSGLLHPLHFRQGNPNPCPHPDCFVQGEHKWIFPTSSVSVKLPERIQTLLKKQLLFDQNWLLCIVSVSYMCYMNVLIFKSTNISKRNLLFFFKSLVNTRRITWPQGSSIPHVARLVRISIIILPCNQPWLLRVWVHPCCPRNSGSNSLWTHQQSMTVKLCIFKWFNMTRFQCLQLVHFTFLDGIFSKHVWGSSPKTNERGSSACTSNVSTSQLHRDGGREHREHFQLTVISRPIYQQTQQDSNQEQTHQQPHSKTGQKPWGFKWKSSWIAVFIRARAY